MYLILDTIRDFRDLGSGVEQISRLHDVAQGLAFASFGSVNEILCQRVHLLGWDHAFHTVDLQATGVPRNLSLVFGSTFMCGMWGL